MAGDAKPGFYDRAQLLKVDPRTQLDVLSESSDDEPDDEAEDEQIDPEPPRPVYPRDRVANNVHRYAIGDVLQFDREYVHRGLGPPRPHQAKITDVYTRRVGGVDYLVYDFEFTLANGRTRDIPYAAKPLPRGDPGRDVDQAIDTSQYVSYVHS